MTIAVGSFTSAAGSAHPAILRRRRPADSRPAACRIIRGGDADGVSLIHSGADHHALDHRIARHRDRAVGDDEDFEDGAFERVALGDAINLLLHWAGAGDVGGDGRINAQDGGAFDLSGFRKNELFLVQLIQ
jgi:hypothetical protein